VKFQQPGFIIEGPRSAAFRTYSKGVAVDGQPFENEYSWFVEFGDDDKIIRMTEMVDSGAFLRWIKLER
jgi:ketosteroid isomerase-like protein